jgi:IclR family pca regulon transcriptional regulator
MDHDSRYFIESLGRGLSILEVFTEANNSLTLVEIAKAVGLDKSTTFRFVYTLESLGYLERDPESKRYRPGLKVLKLGFAALSSLDLAQLAGPRLKALSNQLGETVNMAVRDGAEIVYIVRISPRQVVNINLQIGSCLPVHCTAMGKALLIDMSQDELLELLGPGPYEAFTSNTITTFEGLVANVAAARQRRYAISDEEFAIGLCSVAAPIRQTDGQIVAAINISAPSARLTGGELEGHLAAMVVETAHDISTAIGE